MTKLLGVFAVFLLVSTHCFAYDIVPTLGTKKIEVSLSKDQSRVSFRFCDATQTPACVPMGSRADYSVSEIQSQRGWEIAQAIGVPVAHVAVFLVGGMLADVAWAAASMGVSTATPFWIIGGTIAGQSIIGTVAQSLSPIEQARQVRVISNDVLRDVSVNIGPSFFQTADRRIENLAGSLAQILEKLED